MVGYDASFTRLRLSSCNASLVQEYLMLVSAKVGGFNKTHCCLIYSMSSLSNVTPHILLMNFGERFLDIQRKEK